MPIQFHKLKNSESREQDGEPIYLTEAGVDALRDELTKLKRRVPDLALETQRTAEFGDRSDNAEYKQAKGALRRTHFRILEIESQLKRVVIIPSGPNPTGIVRIGSVVELERIKKELNKPETFHVVGPNETDPARGRISYQSPLGAALIGRGAGEIVAVKTDHGVQEYKIVAVQ